MDDDTRDEIKHQLLAHDAVELRRALETGTLCAV